MNIIHRRGWEIPESEAAPEHLFMSRRALLRGVTAFAGAASISKAVCAEGADPTAALYPAKRNEKFVLGDGRAITPEGVRSGNYNNFYEFGFDKGIASRAQAL